MASLTAAEALPRIVRHLKGRRTGRGFSCRCPCHDDRHPSLSVAIGREGSIVLFCHAGCHWRDLVGYFQRHGLWPTHPLSPAEVLAITFEQEAYARERQREAAQLWHGSVDLAWTPGEHYLRHWRGITAPLGPSLRWNWDNFSLIGLISDAISEEPIGVHITPLDRNTNRSVGFYRSGERQVIGQSGGGVIRLVEAPEPSPSALLVIGEGLETSLSGYTVKQAAAAWCALSASNLQRRLRLPLDRVRIALLVDNDRAGERACRAAAERLCADRPGRVITLCRADPPCSDFNDLHRHARALG